jgi:WD40 repeat protein
MKPCPSYERLLRFLDDVTHGAGRSEIEAHVESCPDCQAALQRLGETPGVSSWRRRWKEADGQPALFLPPSPEAGGRVDRFDLEAKLGSGAMGTVYRARDSRLQRTVALKVINPALAASPGFRSYFDREARAAAGIASDYVVRIFHVGTDSDGQPLPFLVMELIDGETLREHLDRKKVLGAAEAAGIALHVALGLAAMQEKGIVHRDIKPSNIMLDRKARRAKITDFGLARPVDASQDKLTRTGGAPGTPAYMSPEQFDAPDRIDGRSDIFSLGGVLYEMLTGVRPFPGATAEVVAQEVRTASPRPPRRCNPRTPRDLETICLVCLDKDPNYRFADAAALAADLRRFLKHEPIACRRPGLSRRAALFARRHRGLVGLSAAFLAIAMLGATWSLVALSGANRFADAKTREALERKQREYRVRYLADVKDAWKSWEANRPREVRSLLDRHLPQPNSGVPDLRGVEWYYLDRLLGTGFQALDFSGTARCAGFSPDGSRLAIAGISGGEYCVKLWALPSAKPERTLSLGRVTGLLEHEPPVSPAGRQEVAFSPDGRIVAATCVILHPRRREGVVNAWDAAGGRELFSSTETGIGGRAITFSPDGAYLIAGGYNLAALVWELPAGRLRLALPGHDAGSPFPHVADAPARGLTGAGPAVDQLLFTPGGKLLTRSDGKDKLPSPWPPPGLRRPAARTERPPRAEKIAIDDAIAFSPGGQWAVSRDVAEDAVRLFHPFDANRVQPPAAMKQAAPGHYEPAVVKIEQGSIQGAAISNLALALGERNGQVTLVKIDAGSGTAVERIPLQGHQGEAGGLAFNRDGTLLVAAGERAATLWDVSGRPETQLLGRPARFARLPGGVGPAAFSRDGRWGYRADWGGRKPASKPSISLYDTTRPGDPPRRVASPVSAVSAFALSPDGSRLAITGDDPYARNAMIRLCVQVRLMGSAGVSPAGVRAEAP